MLYARIYARGRWGLYHITPTGIRTLCGRTLVSIQAVVEIASQRNEGDVCRKCEAQRGEQDRW